MLRKKATKATKKKKLRIRTQNSGKLVEIVESIRPAKLKKDVFFRPGSIADSTAIYTIVDEKGNPTGDERLVVAGKRMPPIHGKHKRYLVSNKSRMETIGAYFSKNPKEAKKFLKTQKKRIKEKKIKG